MSDNTQQYLQPGFDDESDTKALYEQLAQELSEVTGKIIPVDHLQPVQTQHPTSTELSHFMEKPLAATSFGEMINTDKLGPVASPNLLSRFFSKLGLNQ